MARRRYVSTEISVDTRVNRLAENHGGDAALLYTWMIPHADDCGEITDDAEQLLYMVFPGRRSIDVEDVQRFIDGMIDLRLVEHDSGKLRFPPESFYKYQTYVKTEARRQSAENAEDRRESAENVVARALPPVSVPSPVPVSIPVSSSSAATARAAPQKTDSAPFPIPKPDRVAMFVDAVKAIDDSIPVSITGRDGKAIKDTSAKVADLARAYVAAFRGEWDPGGNGWLQGNLSLHNVIDRIAGFEAHLRAPPKAPRNQRNGQTAVPLQSIDDQRRHYATSLSGQQGGGKAS